MKTVASIFIIYIILAYSNCFAEGLNSSLYCASENPNQQISAVEYHCVLSDQAIENKQEIQNIYDRFMNKRYGLGAFHALLNKNTDEDEKLKLRVDKFDQTLQEQKVLLERLFSEESRKIQEELSDYIKTVDIKIDEIQVELSTGIEQIADEREKDRTEIILNAAHLDKFWVLVAAFLVFFMQPGFKAYETGMVRRVHSDNVAVKNMVDWLVVCTVYWFIGFTLMFGDSAWGLGFIGDLSFWVSYDFEEIRNNINSELDKLDSQNIEKQFLGMEFLIYQMAFAATAATIISGAMSERVQLFPYFIISAYTVLIYSVFGHWVWGGTYFINNTGSEQGWLYYWGFRDFAGSTVVHSVGAWIALAGIQEIGARHGRFNEGTKDNFFPSNIGYSVLGIMMLWIGWWGFNGGSVLKYSDEVSLIILNTNLSAAMAGLTAFFSAYLFSGSRNKKVIFPKALGGILGGLVAITACCDVVHPFSALLIGGIAGLIHNAAYDWMLRHKLDDAVGAIPVHGICGVWGTLCVALFDVGNFSNDWASHIFEYSFLQLLSQILGISVAFLFVYGISKAFFYVMGKYIGLRVHSTDEKNGNILGSFY